MASNPYLSEFMTPCKWSRRGYNQSPIRRVLAKAKLINTFRHGF